MRIFVAGGTGVVGKLLVPRLVARGHEVTATTTRAARIPLIESMGAKGMIMAGLDANSVHAAVAAARPDVIVHQMTAISPEPDMRRIDRWFATTNRLRTEGTDYLLAAAAANGVRHFLAQSYAGWNGQRSGGWVKSEEERIDRFEGTAAQPLMDAIRHLEDVVLAAQGTVLRYGWFYGPGAWEPLLKPVRKRQFPIIGDGAGHCSWLHVEDAADATILAIEREAKGIFNIVDDEPASVREWLPFLAECAGAKPPMRIPKWLARPIAGKVAVLMMTEGRGFSNARAKRELGWTPRYPSWRQGFRELLGGPGAIRPKPVSPAT